MPIQKRPIEKLNADSTVANLSSSSPPLSDKKNLDYINQCFSQLAVESSGRLVDAVKTTEAPPSVQQLLQHEELGGEPRPGPSRPAAFYDVKAVLPHTEEALIEACSFSLSPCLACLGILGPAFASVSEWVRHGGSELDFCRSVTPTLVVCCARNADSSHLR